MVRQTDKPAVNVNTTDKTDAEMAEELFPLSVARNIAREVASEARRAPDGGSTYHYLQ